MPRGGGQWGGEMRTGENCNLLFMSFIEKEIHPAYLPNDCRWVCNLPYDYLKDLLSGESCQTSVTKSLLLLGSFIRGFWDSRKDPGSRPST